MNAMKVGAFDDTANSGKQLELRVGQCLLKLTDRQERSLKLENAVILEEFSHLQLPQPSWMAREGVPTGATHHKVSTLEEINVKTVEGACAWKANVPTPIDLNRFAGRKKKGGGGGGEGSEESEEESSDDDEEEDSKRSDPLRAVDTAARAIIGDRGRPFFACLDIGHSARTVTGASDRNEIECPWWMRFATSSGRAGPMQWGDLMVLLVTSGELRLRIAGYKTLELMAGEAAILSTRLWVSVIYQSGHCLSLCYKADAASKTTLTRSGMGVLVRAGYAPSAPGVNQWVGAQEKRREAEAKAKKMQQDALMKQQPTAWKTTNQPSITLHEEARREAKATAAADKTKPKPSGARKVKPPVAPRTVR